ncbi:hypothetical protein [Marinobacterium arenosum]|uniref:hypothetical protein n=1 Tax=Marinobacterium arenosum TaxID=2862496 RepID=UPI001C95CB85|nr:hypothetical protein [Marinobacterium arenosum]MBY4678233.1 hypothetical protein [Marinobacterium arenosum]
MAKLRVPFGNVAANGRLSAKLSLLKAFLNGYFDCLVGCCILLLIAETTSPKSGSTDYAVSDPSGGLQGGVDSRAAETSEWVME